MAEEDIVFGKKRHYFGGIEPSNMVLFTARMDRTLASVIIEAELPTDTVIDGQTLCTVAGAVIRRRNDRYPVDEFDGDEVDTITGSLTVYDKDIDVDGTYYYAAFPYTTQGVYNRNEVNRASVNEPSPLTRFSVERSYATASEICVLIEYLAPDDSVGIIFRKSTTGYPVDENDGDLVWHIHKIPSTGEFFTEGKDLYAPSWTGVEVDCDTDLDTTYYYSAFTYNARGAFNRSNPSHASCITYRGMYYFGYDLDTKNSDPETRVTYPADVDNRKFNPARMNYDKGVFDYGAEFVYNGWNIPSNRMFMPAPCMLRYDGTVDYYLDPNDYSKKTDGTASDISNHKYEGNAMMEWPKIYTKRWEDDDGIYHFRCSDVKHDDTWECWCNYDKNNNEIDHFYTSIWPCGGIGGKLRSMSGLYYPYYNLWNGQDSNITSYGKAMTAEDMITHAKANGDDWYTDVLADRLLIQDLLVMIAKTTDGQTAYGKGICSVSSASSRDTSSGYNTEETKKGLFYGTDGDYTMVKVFGMNHWWGNEQRYVAGLVLTKTERYGPTSLCAKLTRGVRDGSTATDYDTTGTGYLCLIESIGNGTTGTYYNPNMKFTHFGRVPDGWYGGSPPNGSSSTYECDGTYLPSMSDVSKVGCAYFGGRYDSSVQAGPFMVQMNNLSSTQVAYTNTGLSCKPAKVV